MAVSLLNKLKKTRLKKNISIDTVADSLKIQKSYLHAIESEDWPALPEPVYTIGFIKSYAEFLKIEHQDMVDYYRAKVSANASSKKADVALCDAATVKNAGIEFFKKYFFVQKIMNFLKRKNILRKPFE